MRARWTEMSSTTDQLKRAIQIAEQIQQLEAELRRIVSGVGSGAGVVVSAEPSSKPRKRSAAVRRKMAAAQKARWAKFRAAKGAVASGAASPAPKTKAKVKGKRKVSAEARAKMAAAAKKRW